MSGETIRVWRRRDLEDVAAIEPEGLQPMMRALISPRLLLLLCQYGEAHGSSRVEVISAYGDPQACELRFYRRDTYGNEVAEE